MGEFRHIRVASGPDPQRDLSMDMSHATVHSWIAPRIRVDHRGRASPRVRSQQRPEASPPSRGATKRRAFLWRRRQRRGSKAESQMVVRVNERTGSTTPEAPWT